MAASPVASAKIDAALAAVAAGAPLATAAATHGVSLATLKRYRSGKGAPAGVKVAARLRVATKTAPKLPPAASTEGDERPARKRKASEDEPLLVTLGRELREARKQRRAATEDAARARWSKRVEELVKTIQRLAPAPPPSPDLLIDALRDMDGVVLARVEEHQPDPITAAELAA